MKRGTPAGATASRCKAQSRRGPSGGSTGGRSGLWARTSATIATIAVMAVSTLTCTGEKKKKKTTPSPSRYMAKRSTDPFSALGVMEETAQDQAFKMSPGPKPPRRVTQKVKHAFPPPEKEQGVRQKYGPLKVLRTQPNGKVSKTAAVAVTFNQPMIPLTSLEEQRKIKAPLEIEPKLEGQYRWLGTAVLGFESQQRFPFSTRYTARIPAGTKSAVGGTLEKKRTFTFQTPRTKLTRMMPSRYERHALPDNPIVLRFNQKIDRKDVLAHAELRGGGRKIPLELIPEKQWEKNKRYKHYLMNWEKERTVGLRPVKPMALNTRYTLTLKAGLGSAEGPLKTKTAQSQSFKTYGPLRIKHAGCYRGRGCNPGSTPYVSFTNSLKTNDYTLEKQIRVRPRVKDLKIRKSGSRVYLRGQFKAGRTYRVTVGTKIYDIYKQRLQKRFSGKIVFRNAAPMLHIATGRRGVLEAKAQRTLPVRSVNVNRGRVTLVEVTPKTAVKAVKLVHRSYYRYRKTGKAAKLSGRRITFGQRFNRKRNSIEKSFIKLDRILKRSGGTVFVEVFSNDLRKRHYDYGYRCYLVTLTDLGLTARYDATRIGALVTGITSGRPQSGISLSLFDRKQRQVWQGRTNGRGMANPPGGFNLKGDGPYLMVARKGKDWSFLRLRGSGVEGYVSGYSSSSLPPKVRVLAHIHTDRNPYRPGERVEIVGTLRKEPTGPKGSLGSIERSGVTIRYTLTNPRGRKVKKGTLEVDETGTFHLTFKTKRDAALGAYSFRGRVHGVSGLSHKPYISHRFKVLEYRAPEHETKVEVKGGPHFYGDTLRAEIRGRYHFGAPMTNAKTTWTLRRRRGAYRPPHHSEFHFGRYRRYRPYWRHRYGYRGGRRGHYYISRRSGGSLVASGNGHLDDKGRLQVRQLLKNPVGKKGDPFPGVYTLEAQVFDVNRQSIADRARFVTHPADVYVGVRLQQTIVKAGKPVTVDVVVPDLQGKRVSGLSVTVEATRSKSIRKKVKKKGTYVYEYEYKTVTAGRCRIRSSADIEKCKMVLKNPGYHILTARTTDKQGRRTVTQRGLYVFGKGYIPWRQDNMRKVELIPDKQVYQPGQTARVLIKSPYRRATGILAVERQGLISYRHLDIRSSTHVETVALKTFAIPNVHVSVVLIRGRVKSPKQTGAEDAGRPMFATGRIPLRISKQRKEITVKVKPLRDTIKPGEKLRVQIETRDYKGRPVPARLAFMVVDEGVLSLLGFETPNPLEVFYHRWKARTALVEIRKWLLKKVLPKLRLRPKKRRRKYSTGRRYANGGGRPRVAVQKSSLRASTTPAEAAARVGGARGKGGGPGGGKKGLTFKVRKKFATTAYFNPNVRTNRAGRGELTIEMPENLTAFRLMAVAQDLSRSDRFGAGEAKVRIRKDLLLRPALPRFANFGDIFEAGVVVNNETGGDGKITVKLQGVGFKILESSTKKVHVEHGKAKEVRFKVAVTRPGLARFRFSAFLGLKTDSVEPPPIPIMLPATAEATAVYGVTKKSIAQPIKPPQNALPQFGGMKISMSSTALTGMQDAVKYLVRYPYHCAEQIASRLVPIFSLRDILPEFGLDEVGDKEKQKRFAHTGIKKLISLQRHDGGFKFWASNYRSYPYASVYATWALLRGHKAGFDVPKRVLQKAARYLSRVLSGRLRGNWSIYYAYTCRIMAGWLLTEMRNLPFISKYDKRRWQLARHLQELYEKRNKVGIFAKAWLMTALYRLENRSNRVNELLRVLENAAVQTPYGVHFAEAATESLRLLMHSNTRTDAIVLSAYMEVDKQNAIIPKIVRALMAARVKGRWETTQANAFVMEALASYFRKFEKVEPDFNAHIWYGEGYGGTAAFEGRSMEITERRLPMSFLLRQGNADLILAKKGAGKLYYRLGLSYAPKSLKLPPEEQGFMVRRIYEPVEGADTVVKQKNGVWRVKAGKYVRVRLIIVVTDRRYFVAVNDPMPAGFEGVDLQLRTSARSALAGRSRNKIYDFRSYYSFLGPNHKEMRDERYVLFWDRLPTGVYEYTYLARATTIGRFVVPPLKAMEMYHPEVFGRNATQVVEVVE